MLKISDQPASKKKVKKTRAKRPPRSLNYEKIIARFSRLKPRYLDIGLLIPILGITLFGLAMVYSASWYNSTVYYGTRYHYLINQSIGFVLGLLAMSIAYMIDYKFYKKYYIAIFVFGLALLAAVFLPGIGISRLGANRWIGFGGFTMQPSEIAKFAFIIFAAAIATKTATTKEKAPKKIISSAASNQSLIITLPAANAAPISLRGEFSGGNFPLKEGEVVREHQRVFDNSQNHNILSFKKVLLILAAGGSYCGLVLLEPNLSITLCLGMTMFIVLFIYGAKLKHLAAVVTPALVALPVVLVAEPYRVRRLLAFIDPWARPKDEGFQLIQSLFGLGNGGFFGVGYGHSTQKFMFLPFSESDFIFSIIGEEFGFIGCILFIAVLSYIIYRIFKTGSRCRDNFGKYLCFGIATVIFVQSAVNLAVVTGCIPPTGVPLPFVSFGGTSLAVFMAAIGIVLNVEKNNRKNQ